MRWSLRAASAAVLACAAVAWQAPCALARPVALAPPPVPVPLSEAPPPGRSLSADRVFEIAGAQPQVRRLRAANPGSSIDVYRIGGDRWQADLFTHGGREVAMVVIADRGGRVLHVWSGIQVHWSVARGQPGAFGGQAGALYVWLPLCLLFLAPLVDWRRPLRMLHLDLLVLLCFSVSLAFFNHGMIGVSVPLAYPPLVYLLARMLWLAFRRSAPAPRLPRIGPRWMALGVVVLLAFRIGLNVVDGNVIDVGYAGVIGAQRVVSGRPLYGGYPADNAHGDTYGPADYEAYVPFEQAFGWSGTWDGLPAAHAAAIAFDLIAVLLLFLLGRMIRGPSLGIALAYAWAAYPFTLFALASDSNDALVAVGVLAALLAGAGLGRRRASRAVAKRRAPGPVAGPGWWPAAAARAAARRGALIALTGMVKIAPFALAPLLAADGACRPAVAGTVRRRRCRPSVLAAFCVSFAAAAAVAMLPALAHDSLGEIYARTLGYQAARVTPFSLWGMYGMPAGHLVMEWIALATALALPLAPRRAGLPALAAACAAILIVLQIALDYWFYLYIVWFFPLAMIALLAGEPAEPPLTARERAAASGSARSSRPAAAVSR